MHGDLAAALFLLALVGGCQTRTIVSDAGSDETADGTGDGTGDGTETGEPEVYDCSCVDLGLVCGDSDELPPPAMLDCALPAPCGVVDGSPEAASCVLQLLVDQQPARFYYDVWGGEDIVTQNWRGWFYILDPGQGIDNECSEVWADLSYQLDQTAKFFTLEDPAYFEDCLGKTASVMTGCIFNGLSGGQTVPECGG